MSSSSFAFHKSDFHSLSQSKPVQTSSEIQTIIQKRDQTNSGINFVFKNQQRKQIKQWKSIKIIYENFQIVNRQLTILKHETNTILIHPTIFSFIYSVHPYFSRGCFQGFKMKSVKIPNSITLVDNYCFQKSSSLTQISLLNSITSVDNYFFYQCSSLT
jgi:hypothetical protein